MRNDSVNLAPNERSPMRWRRVLPCRRDVDQFGIVFSRGYRRTRLDLGDRVGLGRHRKGRLNRLVQGRPTAGDVLESRRILANIFITGISGFAGSHLGELCIAEGHAVSGLTRDVAAVPNLTDVRDRVTLFAADLSSSERLYEVLCQAAPDIVFHLAADTGANTPENRLIETNVVGTANLLAAVARLSPVPRVLVASSSAVYGHSASPHANVSERDATTPIGAYGRSKLAQERLALAVGPVLGVPVIVARAFNQSGPRESQGFIASSVAHQIAKIEAGPVPARIAVGRRDTTRDFTDVRDIARGYLLAATRGRSGEVYNLASGVPVSIQDLVDALASLSQRPVEIVDDPARMRPAELHSQVGDATRARQELGWKPMFSFDRMLRDLLDHARSKLVES